MSEQALPEKGFLARAFANRSFVAGFVITALVAAMALLSFFWTPYDVTKLIVADRMQPPSATHIFGTDHFGRDMLSMIMVGARNSIAVALVAVGIGMGIGVPLGCWAAARGGYVDDALMRFNDIVFAFPALLSAIMITAIFGPGAVNAIIAIGIFNIPVFARVARAGALALWPREFVLAARAVRQGSGADHDRTHPAQHRQPAARPGHHPVRAWHSCRSGALLCRAWRAAAHAELGPHAVRRADAHDRGALIWRSCPAWRSSSPCSAST